MNVKITKVNTRCIILFAFVLIIMISPKNISAEVIPTDPPESLTPSPIPTRSQTFDDLEDEENKFLDDQYGGYRSNYEKEQLKKQQKFRSILDQFFSSWGATRSLAPTSSPSRPDPTPTGGQNSTPITSDLQGIIPTGEAPAGLCTRQIDDALAKLESYPSNIEIYKTASRQTGVAWEVLAAIHYIEATFNPNKSLISGRAIGQPEPDQGNKVYSSLLETAIDAANFFRGKRAMVEYVIQKNGMPSPTSLELLAGQFASYNSPTQGECAMEKVGSDYNLVFTGKTWSGIPDNGQCRGNGGSHTKGESFVGDRHVYATRCLDTSHEPMYFHFHYGEKVIRYESHVGAIALIRAIQKKYKDYQMPSNNQNNNPSNPNYTPVTSAGLVYYPQCSSPALPVDWSSKPMPGCNDFCNWGCGIVSSAMIFSSFSGRRLDPLQFVNYYVSQGAPNCLLDYARLKTIFEANSMTTGAKIYPNPYISLTSAKGIEMIDGYLGTGYTILVGGDINNYGHFVWIVGKKDGYYEVMDPYWSSPPRGTSPDFPVVPYQSNRYKSFYIKSLMPVKKTL